LNSTDDNDFMLIPYIIEKHILNKLIALIENNIYDPLSTSQTTRLTNLVKYLINNYPTINGQSENTKKLIQVSIARIKKCIDQVIFVPLYPRQ
jgi:GC-rich sequence DNA-binding factor